MRVSIEVALEPAKLFDILVDELAFALSGRGMHFEHGPNGRVIEHEFEVGRVVAWEPPARVLLEWHPAEWEPDHTTAVELRLEAVEGGTRTMVEHRGWGRLVGGPEERTGWFADQVAAPLLKATAPAALGDWLTDRQARRPSGAQSRSVYRDPLYHYPNFRVIHQELALGPHDYLLEVGCGGGAMLKEALRSGCRAAAVDHSADMVALATAENRQAVADGRLEIRQASADRLPFADSTFSHAAMTGVLGFLPDPMAALSEIRRVLARGGTFVTLGSDVELKGTPGAPEPMASRLQFYDDDQLAQLARGAGFDDVHVIHRDLEPFAREAGVPEEHLMLFAGPTTRFLIAHKG